VIYLHIFAKRKEERLFNVLYGSLCFVPALSEWPFVICGITSFCWVEMMFKREKMPSAFNRDAIIVIQRILFTTFWAVLCYATILCVFVCVWAFICVRVLFIVQLYIFQHSLLWISLMEKLSLVCYFVTELPFEHLWSEFFFFFFFKKKIILISKNALIWSEVTLKTFIILQKKCCSSLHPEKNVSWFPQKISSSTTIFNIDDNKTCFLSSQLTNKNDFSRIMWHWRIK